MAVERKSGTVTIGDDETKLTVHFTCYTWWENKQQQYENSQYEYELDGCTTDLDHLEDVYGVAVTHSAVDRAIEAGLHS